MKIEIDVFGGNSDMKMQNEMMHCVDMFEAGKQLAQYNRVTMDIEPQSLKGICEIVKGIYEEAGGYVLFAAISRVDGKREPHIQLQLKEGIQTLSMLQNGSLGWTLFKDALVRLGYSVETDERMRVTNVTPILS